MGTGQSGIPQALSSQPVSSGSDRFASLVSKTQDYLDRLGLPPDVLQGSAGMVYGEQSKYLRWEVPSTFKSLELVQLTDLQFGHLYCAEKRVYEFRDWVLKEPNRYMLWCGDNIDAATILTKRHPNSNKGDPKWQAARFAEIWAPARHRILLNVGGNHERAGIPSFGDIGGLIAMLLKLPYSDGQQYGDIYFGNHKPFKVHVWHGAGSARTYGGVAIALERLMKMTVSDLYLMGHLHTPMSIVGFHQKRDERRNRIILQKCIGACGSSFLEYWGTYGEVSGFRAHDVVMPRVTLWPSGEWELVLR